MAVFANWSLLLAVGLVLVASRSFVSTAPARNEINGSDQSGSENNQGVDEDVKELELLKPKEQSISVVKSHSAVFTNINGKTEGHTKTKEEVDQDGEMFARMAQEVDKSGEQPAVVKTSLDIPSRNLHKTIEQIAPQHHDKRNMFSQRPKSMDNNVDPYKGYNGLHYSPLDMAEYVFWTGDENGVTSAIEEFLQNGMMNRDEAINFLQDIKMNLEYLQTHYNEERYHAQQAKEKMEERTNPEMSQVRRQVQDAMNKKSDLQDVNGPQIGSAITEDDYEELMEKLKVADLLYNEYSLEEVIYQLAKLMFTQSLTRVSMGLQYSLLQNLELSLSLDSNRCRIVAIINDGVEFRTTPGSAEAQDALQKFTSFLEFEALQGRISRNLEKKVLDVLIASLSDTLTEHPELVSTARESLLEPSGSHQGMTNEHIIQTFINQPKQIHSMDQAFGSSGVMKQQQQHRFQVPSSAIMMKQTLQNSGLQDQEKKSN